MYGLLLVLAKVSRSTGLLRQLSIEALLQPAATHRWQRERRHTCLLLIFSHRSRLNIVLQHCFALVESVHCRAMPSEHHVVGKL